MKRWLKELSSTRGVLVVPILYVCIVMSCIQSLITIWWYHSNSPRDVKPRSIRVVAQASKRCPLCPRKKAPKKKKPPPRMYQLSINVSQLWNGFLNVWSTTSKKARLLDVIGPIRDKLITITRSHLHISDCGALQRIAETALASLKRRRKKAGKDSKKARRKHRKAREKYCKEEGECKDPRVLKSRRTYRWMSRRFARFGASKTAVSQFKSLLDSACRSTVRSSPTKRENRQPAKAQKRHR